MNPARIRERFEAACSGPVPLSGAGATPARLARLMEMGREDLSLAKLVEAHWDAVAILAEAGRESVAGALYAVWAAEIPGSCLTLSRDDGGLTLNGHKAFCSGAGLVDRALVTVTCPEQQLVDLDLRANADNIRFDGSFWRTSAFAATQTANAAITHARVQDSDLIEGAGWYLSRPGFWHVALGPAACWAGGAEGLVDYALKQKRRDTHTLAHLGAMQASVWAMRACLATAGAEIDESPFDCAKAYARALTVRHLVEQFCTDILRRFARAYGPYPLAADEEISRRYIELDLYLRQSHAERDLEALGATTPAR
jgi:alkylation response protein AidB-like acyl-CoA dehydrogenase